ncbi:MAG TPA: VTT domain-containing protein [Candidatus Angelobacter sp.]|jgi:membrane protein YqaA with SNARE-associated domain
MLYLIFSPLGAWLEKLGGLGLVLLGFADNSVVPMPGSMDALTIVLSAHQKTLWPYYAVMATIGGVLGGYMTYALGAKGGEASLEKKLSKKKAERIYKIFNRFGFWSLFVPALLPPPVPFSPFLLVAGAMKYSKRNFFIAVGLARAIRYSLLAWMGSIYSKQIFGSFHRYYGPVFWVLIVLAVIGGIAALVWARKRKRDGKPVIPDFKEPKAKLA